MQIRPLDRRSLRGLTAAAIALVAFAVAGCGEKQASTPTTSQAEPTVAAPAAAPAPAAAAVKTAPPGETVADTGASSVLSPVAAAVAANAPAPAGGTPVPSKWVDGKNYVTLMPAQPTSVGPDKVEVVEVFWYGCGHCFHLDPFLETWKTKQKPAYVEFVRVPVMWNDVTKAHARLYYTMEALGKLEQLHTLAFREIHVKNNMLVDRDPAKTEQIQREFLKANGVSDADFDRVYRSFSVENKLARAEQLTRRLRVTGVPLMAVNGKYTTDVGMAGGETQLLQLVDDLAASEKRR